MDLLKYEFYKGAKGAYYDLIGQLVASIRHYRNNVSIEEFKAALPELNALERRIQDVDKAVTQDTRDYFQEIMDELEAESELEEKVIGEIERSSKAIASVLYDADFSMTDFAYEFRNSEAVYWIEFYGYKSHKGIDGTLLVVKEVFRSASYKFGIVFIDSSLNDK